MRDPYEPATAQDVLSAFVKLCAIALCVLWLTQATCSPAYGTTMSCKAYQYPRIKCEATWTPHLPKWEVSDGDDIRDVEYGNVVYLTINQKWLLITIKHRDTVLSQFEVRWYNGRTQFRR